MTKTWIKLFSALILLVFLVSLASAQVYYDYGYGNVRTTTTTETTTTAVIHHPYGTERKTITVKETSSKNNFAPQYYPTQAYQSNFYPAPSSFRYKQPYSYSNYPRVAYVVYNDNQEHYTTPYYYNAQYDNNLGYYNWRY